MDDAALRRSRTLAAALEPVIGQVFFSPECHAAYARARVRAESRDAWAWSRCPTGPRTSRAAGSLLGQVRPGVVAAAFGVFKPEVVSAGVTLGWSLTDAPTIFAERRAGARRATRARARRRRRAARDRARRCCSSARSSRSASRAAPLFAGLRSWWDDPADAVDAPVPPRRHAPRVPRRRAHLVVDERRARRRRDRPAQRRVHGTPAAQLRAHARLERRRARSGRGAAPPAGLAGRRRRSATTAATRAKTSSARPTARWRPRSTRSATTSTSWSGCSSRGDAVDAEVGGVRRRTGRSLARPRRLTVTVARVPARADRRLGVVRVPRPPQRHRDARQDARAHARRRHLAPRDLRARCGERPRRPCAARVARPRCEVTLECDGARDAFAATISPFFLGDSSLVFRRGAGLRGRTIAFDASKTAAAIDRDLVARLGSSRARVARDDHAPRATEPAGALFVVSLPIGNDADIGRRAVEVLERVDLVLAEDTRRLRALGQRIGIDVARAHELPRPQRVAERVDGVLERLRRGARVALVSDAGTPLCSDPGYVVVSRAVAEGIPVCPVPGPSAALAVLAASGLPVDRFVFGGLSAPPFGAAPPGRARADRAPGARWCSTRAAPRVAETLADIAAVCPEWRVCLGREVTKTFEEFRYGDRAELAARDREREAARRVHARDRARRPTAATATPATERDRRRDRRRCCARCSHRACPRSTLAQALRSLPGIGRNQAYERVLALGRDQPPAMTLTQVVGQGPHGGIAGRRRSRELQRRVRGHERRRRHRRRAIRVPPRIGATRSDS